MHGGNTATPHDDVIQSLARRDEAPTEDVPGDNREAEGGHGSLTQERTTG